MQNKNVTFIKPFVIGVGGGTGSGKTTAVRRISNLLNDDEVLIIQHDTYYHDRSSLAFNERENINFDHPSALETSLLIEHLLEIKANRKVVMPAYDFTNHTRKKEGIKIEPHKIIIVEGVLILVEKDLRELMDIKIFVDADDDIRFIRRLQRDIKERERSMESVIQQYMETVKPMHLEFVEPSKKYADLIIPEGHNQVAIDVVVSMIMNKLFGLRAE